MTNLQASWQTKIVGENSYKSHQDLVDDMADSLSAVEMYDLSEVLRTEVDEKIKVWMIKVHKYYATK